MARETLAVQDACNLSAVVHAFSRITTELRNLPECSGTGWINNHPISVLFSNKIANLTGSDNARVFSSAYDAVERMI